MHTLDTSYLSLPIHVSVRHSAWKPLKSKDFNSLSSRSLISLSFPFNIQNIPEGNNHHKSQSKIFQLQKYVSYMYLQNFVLNDISHLFSLIQFFDFSQGILADVVPFHLQIKTIKDLKSYKTLKCQSVELMEFYLGGLINKDTYSISVFSYCPCKLTHGMLFI